MLAKRYTGKKLVDNIFATSKKAKQAIKEFGKENVINATIGSLYNEDEKLDHRLQPKIRHSHPQKYRTYKNNALQQRRKKERTNHHHCP